MAAVRTSARADAVRTLPTYRLRAATDRAIERGVTGVPTVAVGDQLFWDDDQLEAAAAAILSSGKSDM